MAFSVAAEVTDLVIDGAIAAGVALLEFGLSTEVVSCEVLRVAVVGFGFTVVVPVESETFAAVKGIVDELMETGFGSETEGGIGFTVVSAIGPLAVRAGALELGVDVGISGGEVLLMGGFNVSPA